MRRRVSSRDASSSAARDVEGVIARARAAVEHVADVDPVAVRVAELEVELEENGERRVTPWTHYAEEGALRAVAVRPDGVRVEVTGYVPPSEQCRGSEGLRESRERSGARAAGLLVDG